MEISFVRTHNYPDRIYVLRTNGTEVSWSFPTFGNYVPHDLVHLVVETAFGLKHGFWGKVDAGIDVARINAMANRAGGANKYAAFGADQAELGIAEMLAARRWGDSTLSDEDIAKEIAGSGAGLKNATAEHVAAVRAVLDRLCVTWMTLFPKGAIKVTFDPDNPESSFGRMIREGEWGQKKRVP
jgi:hypothetical protein